MRIGINTFTRTAMVTREAYVTVGQKAEALGYDFITVSDHVIVPGNIVSKYPYTEGGVWPGKAVGHCFEQLSVLSFLAGCTQTIRLVTSVMVVPHRPPVLTAKMLATVDVLSGGRVTMGIGAGWMREEFEALGAAPFEERGAVTDEYVDAMRALWTQERPGGFEGRHVRFGEVVFEPKPLQSPHPPIWVGGEGKVAKRRALRLGATWYPASNNPKDRYDTAARLAAGIADYRAEAEKAGKDPAGAKAAFVVLWPVDWTARADHEGGRKIFTGTSADLAADLDSFAAIGITDLALTFQTNDLGETLDRMQRFSEEVLPSRK